MTDIIFSIMAVIISGIFPACLLIAIIGKYDPHFTNWQLMFVYPAAVAVFMIIGGVQINVIMYALKYMGIVA